MPKTTPKIKKLPILSCIPYSKPKVLKYHLSTTKLRIERVGDSGKLKHFKRIQCFVRLSYSPIDHFNDLYKFLGKINRIRSIEIDLSHIQNITLVKEKLLSKSFQHLRHLAVLKINGRESSLINDEKINRIMRAATILRSITEFCADFFRCYNLSEEGTATVISYLANLPILDKLRINYESCHDQSSRGIVKMGQCLRTFKQLKDFAFSICALSVFTSNISEEGFSKFVEYMSELKGMEKLYVHFRNCSMRNNNVIKYFSRKISEMTKIRVLNVHLTGFVKIDDKGFEYLGQNLSRMTNLEQLGLDLRSSSEITDECISVLCHQVAKLQKLEDLLLNFNVCQKVTDQAIKAIGDNIVKLDLKKLQLQVIGFSLFMPTIGEEGLLYLAQKISQLSQLKVLGIDFGNSPLLDDSFFANMLDSIIMLQNLTKLQMNIENLSKISDLSLKTLNTKILKLERLEKIDFCFQNCYSFTEEGVKGFLKKLNQNENLKEIKLGFLGSNFSPETVEYGKSISVWKE